MFSSSGARCESDFGSGPRRLLERLQKGHFALNSSSAQVDLVVQRSACELQVDHAACSATGSLPSGFSLNKKPLVWWHVVASCALRRIPRLDLPSMSQNQKPLASSPTPMQMGRLGRPTENDSILGCPHPSLKVKLLVG